MQSRTVRLGVILIGILLGLICATQFVAAGFGYDPRLGFGLARFGGRAIYLPLAAPYWAFTPLYRNAPDLFDKAEFLFGLCVAGAALVVMAAERRRKVLDFGKAAWGTLQDARHAGLIQPHPVGVIVGKWGRRILSFSGPEHHLVAGASRAGKGIGHVIPTLLSWPHSVLVYDPKEECYDITAAFRRRFSYTFFLNFTRKDSAHFNPLFEVRRGSQEIADVQNIASILVDPGGVHDTLDFFQTSAKELITAVILHNLYAAPLERKNLAAVRSAILQFDQTAKEMLAARHRPKADPAQPDGQARDAKGEIIWESHPEAVLIAHRYLEMDGRVRDSVLATASTCLELYADPVVAELTSRSDFTIGDLVCSDAPVSCYLQTPPSDATRLKPLTRLILSQVALSLMRNLDADAAGRPKKFPLLHLVDEFPTLGRLGFFTSNLRVMAGYGLKAMLIVQSFKDIVEAYGEHNTIVDNCHVIVAFATSDSDTARKISEMTGRAVEYRQSHNIHLGSWMRGSRSYQEVQRNVLEPGDVRKVPYDQQLVFVTGTKPFKTRKLRYFDEPLYRQRATDIRSGGKGPDQSKGPYVPRKDVTHDWLKFGGQLPASAPTQPRSKAPADPTVPPPSAFPETDQF
jgi:type IV secretion system protein VirD4